MKKRSLKTKLLALSVVLILAALSVYGTLAYFTAQGTARNAVTTGDIKISWALCPAAMSPRLSR